MYSKESCITWSQPKPENIFVFGYFHNIKISYLPAPHQILLIKTLLKKKVPKCEIFDRSDFHDFYSIKPFWVGDFGAKI